MESILLGCRISAKPGEGPTLAAINKCRLLQIMSDTPFGQQVSAGGRQQNRLKPLTARSLAVGGLALIAVSLNSLAFALIPLQLSSPDWLLRVINALLANSLQLLLGILVLLVARALNGRDLKLAKRLAWIEKAARWWGILLLLSIPLQIYAGTTSIEQQEASENTNVIHLRQMLEMINAAKDESQLRQASAGNQNLPNLPSLPILLSSPNLPNPASHFEAPFPVAKDRIIANLNSKLDAALKERLRLNPERWQSFIADAIRNGIQAGLLATAFLKITKYHSKISTRSRSQSTIKSYS